MTQPRYIYSDEGFWVDTELPWRAPETGVDLYEEIDPGKVMNKQAAELALLHDLEAAANEAEEACPGNGRVKCAGCLHQKVCAALAALDAMRKEQP